ncbi:cysteine-rich CWC family protein [Coraliomargarita akajimensis]|uniref:Cysteine-rich CWC n=1 Tax=Coraliomargarita akajimensis (strain DSM 45221 / IAM 15411 / JCM 23193 / KCTC 12865 / 04OKA010-24) TaxID=583355 RepID=D5EJ91_CORAD|nr:cysteine-rich CWC family protein [Coraliomargarita akajimensis]ADE54490.1 conserved hypothetical protein [Coraliomargarita akajimensis DSM 45221]
MDAELKRCPFCEQANECGAEESGRCWCCSTPIPAGLLELLADSEQGKRCVCRQCVQAFQADSAAFERAFAAK